VAFYQVLACAISWPLFAWHDLKHASWAAWELPTVVKQLVPGFGPAIAGLVATVVFRRTHRRTVSLLGFDATRSLAFSAIPVGMLAFLGVPGPAPHIEGGWIGAMFFVRALLEETGWRGFLQDALRPLAPLRRSVVIGILWGLWTFTTLLQGAPTEIAGHLAGMLVVWIAGSWALGMAVDRTGAVLVPAAMHIALDLGRALPSPVWVPVLGSSVLLWALMLRTWPTRPTAPAPVS
jgi:membrane protease YdiL (CAAX protease family)